MSQEEVMIDQASSDRAVQWLDDHGDALYAYAVLRVRQSQDAEDLVQETLLAAIRARDAFDGDASERTWLISILKHKIADHLRRALRDSGTGHTDGDAAVKAVEPFDKRGVWTVSVKRWPGTPSELLEQAEFRDVLARCLAKLPARMAQLFWLRAAEGKRTAAVCEELEISTDNAWTLLHRARSRLRQCLASNWFGRGDGR
ncbi:MAG TPA: sigma-70 family RNA polymerase sigma factor [Tepidisphaeraceae bacterium]|nr:sigma-70 family RNA polymerase sigma factor [Tepidisphaeraceae bacterium]